MTTTPDNPAAEASPIASATGATPSSDPADGQGPAKPAASSAREAMVAKARSMLEAPPSPAPGSANPAVGDPTGQATAPATSPTPGSQPGGGHESTDGQAGGPARPDADDDGSPAMQEKFKVAMRRSQWTDAEMDALTLERIAQIGRPLMKREATQSRDRENMQAELFAARAEVVELRRRLAQTPGTAPGIAPGTSHANDNGSGAAPTGAAAANPDAKAPAAAAGDGKDPPAVKDRIAAALRPLASDPLYGGLVPHLQEAMETIVGDVVSRAAGREAADPAARDDQTAIHHHEQFLRRQQRAQDERELRAQGKAMQADFPELADPAVYARVEAKAYELSRRHDDYIDAEGEPKFSELMRDAAVMVIRTQNPTRRAMARQAADGRLAAASAPAPDRGSPGGQAQSPRQKMVDKVRRMIQTA